MQAWLNGITNASAHTDWSSRLGYTEPFLQPAEELSRTVPYDRKHLLLLALTIAFEVSGTLMLKAGTDNMRIMLPAFVLYFAGLVLFTQVLKHIPLAIAYTTWCAIGTIGVTVSSVVLYGETLSIPKFVCILCTIPCVAGLYVLP